MLVPYFISVFFFTLSCYLPPNYPCAQNQNKKLIPVLRAYGLWVHCADSLITFSNCQFVLLAGFLYAVQIIYTIIYCVVYYCRSYSNSCTLIKCTFFQARRTSRKSKALVWFMQTVCRRGEGTNLPKHLINFSNTRYKFTSQCISL
jgi:hypothetical protein